MLSYDIIEKECDLTFISYVSMPYQFKVDKKKLQHLRKITEPGKQKLKFKFYMSLKNFKKIDLNFVF